MKLFRTGVSTVVALVLGLGASTAARAQGQQVSAICSTDQSWCELAAKEFQAHSGIKVLQVKIGRAHV